MKYLMIRMKIFYSMVLSLISWALVDEYPTKMMSADHFKMIWVIELNNSLTH